MCIQKTRLACIKIGDVTVKQSESPCPPGRWQGQVLTRGREEPARSLNRRKAPPSLLYQVGSGAGGGRHKGAGGGGGAGPKRPVRLAWGGRDWLGDDLSEGPESSGG